MDDVLELERHGDVAVITWNADDNRVNHDSLGAFEAVLDELEATEGPLAIVVTGTGKFFSNGLDLDRFAAHPDELVPTVARFERLMGRLLVFPAYCVAAINGHAFAAGAMFSCAFDHRVMRADRGYFCLNEAEIGMPLTPAMAEVVLGRLPQATALEAMLTARRYSATEAIAAGIVEEAVELDEVLPTAIDRAAMAATKHRKIIAIHKRMVFAGRAEACGYTR